MKHQPAWMLVMAVLFAVTVLAACGGGSPAALEVKMDASEFRFHPATSTAKVGQPERVIITNTGALEHTITITELGVDKKLPAGETVTVEFTPAQSGTFELVCTVPGHKEAGMLGAVVVDP